MKRVGSLTFLISLAIFWPGASHALPSGFRESVVVSGLTSPTAMAFLPDGRLLVAEQAGTLRVIKRGKLLSRPYVSVTTDSAGERGLLGVAVDPKFQENRYIYVYYTVPGDPPHNRVRRYTQSSTNPDIAQPGSGRTIVDLDDLTEQNNHNGGAIHFGPDGRLYIAVGDNANSDNAQLFTNRLGKILRVNAIGSIPRDNPLLSQTSGLNRAIWAYGLRNPFTFAFDPVTQRMFINDVGQSAWEEVNLGKAGANYGWPDCEGKCSLAGKTAPIYQYENKGGAAITGGAFYRDSLFPSPYYGSYFFGDYLQNIIRRRASNGRVTTFHSQAKGPVDIQIGGNGRLYYASVTEGKVYRISYY